MEKINDVIHGEIDIPSYLQPLISSNIATRARGITMGTIPNRFLPFGQSTRFHHGLGAMHLAVMVCKYNPDLEQDKVRLLCAAAMMHDYGNPPFAHVTEPLLKEYCGHNGESYLIEIVDRFNETRQLLIDAGVDLQLLLDMVSGKYINSFHSIITGSIDTDNLDNIQRAAFMMGFGKYEYNPAIIAAQFRWEQEQWIFHYSPQLVAHLLAWKQARKKVYTKLFTNPHLLISSMLSAALFYAKEDIWQHPDFFSFDDDNALHFLANSKSSITRSLLEKLHRWQFLDQIHDYSTVTPSKRLTALVNEWDQRMILAEQLSKQCNVRPDQVTIFIGIDGAVRNISVPILENQELRGINIPLETPLYRVQINIDNAKNNKRLVAAAEQFAQDYII